MNIIKSGNALCFQAGMAIDVDGSPSAYHLTDGSGIKGEDFISDAGEEGDWYGVVTDNGLPSGNPVEQGENDPDPGFLISQTACEDHTKDLDDPARYLDADKVRYISVPPELEHMGVKMGDFCVVTHKSFCATAIVGDSGPAGKFGEGSPALAIALHIPSSPRNGGVSSGVNYVIFPGTTDGFPKGDFTSKADSFFQAWGGLAKLNEVLGG
jgi:hypothetical protein